ncbi:MULTISPECIES: transposase [Paraburkholderia]|uniref:Transposase n=1 Tax=Paraburkholderia metrosideri TaxID=580937 RepID=A0ABW9E483_9BURK
MKKIRHTDQQMLEVLREADCTPVADVAKKHGISEQTIYYWRQHLAALDSTNAKRLRELERENIRLKQILADRELELTAIRSVTRSAGAQRA